MRVFEVTHTLPRHELLCHLLCTVKNVTVVSPSTAAQCSPPWSSLSSSHWGPFWALLLKCRYPKWSTLKSPSQFSCQSCRWAPAPSSKLSMPLSSPRNSGIRLYVHGYGFFKVCLCSCQVQTSFLLSQITLMFPARSHVLPLPTHFRLQFWPCGAGSARYGAESKILQSFLRVSCIQGWCRLLMLKVQMFNSFSFACQILLMLWEE